MLMRCLRLRTIKPLLRCFAKKVDSGDVIERKGAGFHDPDFLFITFEKVDRDATTKVNIGKTSVGVQMGTTSVGAG
jgi:hypothetical protein